MSMTIHSARRLADALVAEGLLPKQTRSIELLVPPDGALVLRYEVFLDREQCRRLAHALLRFADDGQSP